jgi:hypothetical protein
MTDKPGWQYKLYTFHADPPEAAERQLNKFGADGWEIILAQPSPADGPGWFVAIMRRPL